jgi:hypothetical protein
MRTHSRSDICGERNHERFNCEPLASSKQSRRQWSQQVQRLSVYGQASLVRLDCRSLQRGQRGLVTRPEARMPQHSYLSVSGMACRCRFRVADFLRSGVAQGLSGPDPTVNSHFLDNRPVLRRELSESYSLRFRATSSPCVHSRSGAARQLSWPRTACTHKSRLFGNR